MDVLNQKCIGEKIMIDNIPLPFASANILFDESGEPVDLILTDINDSFAKIANMSRDTIIGNKLSEYSVDFQDIFLKDRIHKNLEKGNTKAFQFELFIDSRQKWIDIFAIQYERSKVNMIIHDYSVRESKAESQLMQLNNIFNDLGIDPEKNIEAIVKKTCEILNGSCSFYLTYDDKLHLLKIWTAYNLPPDFNREMAPDGNLCYETTIIGGSETVVIEDLEKTKYYKNSEFVKKLNFKSYFAHPVTINGTAMGSLCIFDTRIRNFSETEIQIIRTMVAALSLEHQRLILERNLTKARNEAESANLAKSQFLANMSHEIRTPLNGIMGFSEMLLSQEKDSKKSRMLRLIEESGQQLFQIINDIFDYSMIEAGKIRLKELDFGLKDIISETVGFFNNGAQEKGLEVVVNNDGIDENDLYGDFVKFSQVLVNVVSNAIKFTDEGSVFIISHTKRKKEIVHVNIVVEDTGIGINQEQLTNIFDEFEQLEHYLTKRIKGTGLGLAITKKLVDFLNGEIVVESEPGKGSRFIINIPFQSKTQQKSELFMENQNKSSKPDSKAIKILLAEDNEANQFLIKAITRSNNWDITVVDNGEQAVNKYRENEYDLILMDVQMPIMNGYEATKLIRDIEKEKGLHTPIIALTAYAMKSDREQCMEAGMDDYISKPFKRQQFLDAVAKNLS